MKRVITDHWPLLVPDDDFRLSPGDSVLDVGTGAGDWLLETAEYYLSQSIPDPGEALHFKGIDISTKYSPQIPRSLRQSPNVDIKLEEASVLSLPLGWTNTQSLVHQRYLIAALRAPEWELAISEIHRVLKPSGWLVLVEAGTINAGPYTEKLLGTIETFFKSKDLLMDCARRIPAILREKSLTGGGGGGGGGGDDDQPRFKEDTIGFKIYRIPLGAATLSDPDEKRLALDAAKNFLEMFRSMKIMMPAGEDYGKLMDEVEKEWYETEGSFVELILIHAKKA